VAAQYFPPPGGPYPLPLPNDGDGEVGPYPPMPMSGYYPGYPYPYPYPGYPGYARPGQSPGGRHHGPNLGPTEIPAKEDANHRDVYLPPFDAANPKAQFRFRYDAKTDSYAAIAEYNPQTGWRDFNTGDFQLFNKGDKKIKSDSSEQVSTNGVVTQQDSKTHRQIVVGMRVNGKTVYLPTYDTARRASGAGKQSLPAMPKPKDDADSGAVVLPPPSADGSRQSPQFIMRKDEETGTWLVVGEFQSDGDHWNRLDYDEATYKRVNDDYTYGEEPDIPAEDPEHPDFSGKTDTGQRVFYRWFPEEHKYKLAGLVDGQSKLPMTDKSVRMFNAGHTAPHSPDEVTLDDVRNPTSEPDKYAPPAGQPNSTSYILRYNAGCNSYFVIGEVATDANGTRSEPRMYDSAEFKGKNAGKTAVKGNKDDYETDDGLLARKDPDTGKVTIVGVVQGKEKFYFDTDTSAFVNAKDNVTGANDAKNAKPPGDDPPRDGSGVAAGHPDFVSLGDNNTDHAMRIWRWDDAAQRYCCVGEYDDNGIKYRMFSSEEYREKNTGADRLRPPAELTKFTYPEFEESNATSKYRVAEDERIGLYDVPDAPSRRAKEGSGKYGYQGHPIYKKLKDGSEVIVGVKVYHDEDGRMKDDASPRIHYFTKEEYEYYNPDGKAMTDKKKLHEDKWTTFKGVRYNDRKDPSYPSRMSPYAPKY